MKSIFEKRYISSKQALAGAAKAGLKEGEFEVDRVQGQIGGACWFVKPVEQEEKVAPGARQQSEAAIQGIQASIESATTTEQVEALYNIMNAAAKVHGWSEAVVAALDEAIGFKAEQIESEQALTQAQVAGVSELKNGKPWVKASTALKPTKLVWAIADSMYEEAERRAEELGQAPVYPSRKEVQEVCVSQGIASGTARTQFQHWFKQRNESAAAPRATIGPDGKIVPAKA